MIEPATCHYFDQEMWRPTNLLVAAFSRSMSSTTSTRPSYVPSEAVIAGLPYWHTDESYRRQPLPSRDDETGNLYFPDAEIFRPNLTPAQVLQFGAFGGGYYRPIVSKTAKQAYGTGVHLEFPPEWFDGLDVSKYVTSEVYNKNVNKYGVKSGNDLEFWERKGWMEVQDPYGWFQWYCRFYLGRRSEDDERQISRWVKAIGDKGRWRTFLVGQCVKSDKTWDDFTASPVTRQTLLHWGYQLTKDEFDRLAGPIRAGKSVIYLGKVANNCDDSAQSEETARRSSKRQKR